MADDLKWIKQLKKETRGKLKQLELGEILKSSNNAFSMDENGHVNGLNLDKMKLGKIPLIITRFLHLKKLSLFDYLPGKSRNKYKVKDLLGTIAANKATEEEILQLLRKIKSDTDTFESLFKKASDVIIAQPSILGFGIDLKMLIQKIFQKSPKKKNSK